MSANGRHNNGKETSGPSPKGWHSPEELPPVSPTKSEIPSPTYPCPSRQLKEAFSAKTAPGHDTSKSLARNTERINFLITETAQLVPDPPNSTCSPMTSNGISGQYHSIPFKAKITAQQVRVRRTYCNGSPAVIRVDREQITRVFSNVMINAHGRHA
jgi:hypothetical protein